MYLLSFLKNLKHACKKKKKELISFKKYVNESKFLNGSVQYIEPFNYSEVTSKCLQLDSANIELYKSEKSYKVISKAHGAIRPC